MDRRSSCRDISSRNPERLPTSILFNPRKASGELVPRWREEKKKKQPLPSIRYLSGCVCPWRRGWLGGGSDVEKSNRRWRRMIPPDFRTRQKSCEKHFWQTELVVSDIVNGLPPTREGKRENEERDIQFCQNFPPWFTRVHYYFRATAMITPPSTIRELCFFFPSRSPSLIKSWFINWCNINVRMEWEKKGSLREVNAKEIGRKGWNSFARNVTRGRRKEGRRDGYRLVRLAG